MKDRLEARSTKVLTYQTYSTTDGKKMKLELPVEKTVVSTEETTPSLEDLEEVTTRRKVITITKRTYRSSGGTPTETRTTVARIMSAEGLSDGKKETELCGLSLKTFAVLFFNQMFSSLKIFSISFDSD